MSLEELYGWNAYFKLKGEREEKAYQDALQKAQYRKVRYTKNNVLSKLVAGSNYEVNIQLNVKKINQQLNNLERRIKKLNDIAMGQKGVGKAALKTQRDKLALATKTFRREQQITKEKAKQNKLENSTAKVKKSIPRHSGTAMGPSSPLKFTSQGTLLPGKPGGLVPKAPAFTRGDIDKKIYDNNLQN